jgi:uncharacterized protein (TIGR03118 family)
MQRAMLNQATMRVADTTEVSGRVTADDVNLDRFHNRISKVCASVAATSKVYLSAATMILGLGLVLAFLSNTALAQFKRTNLTSNQFGHATNDDPLIANAWGMARSAVSPWWISDNMSGWATLYDGNGVKVALNVSILPATPGDIGSPTGIVFNTSKAGEFAGAPFIFVTLDGTVAAWEPGVTRSPAQIVVPPSGGASFTGLAITAHPKGTPNFLFAADNANNVIDIFDGNFVLRGTFAADPNIPTGPNGFSVNGIRDINGTVFVALAANNGGAGGFVDTFKEDGTLIGTFAQGAPLNQPWGFAVAPGNFGPLSNTLLISNNVNNTGTINGFDPRTGKFVATLTRHGRPINIDQLWAIDFGGGASNATPSANGLNNELFFTAGPHNNVAGTFGKIRFVGDADDGADDQ